MQTISPIKPFLLLNSQRLPVSPGKLVLAPSDRFERTRIGANPHFGAHTSYDPRFWVVTENLPAAFIKIGNEVWVSPVSQKEEQVLLQRGSSGIYDLLRRYQMLLMMEATQYEGIQAAQIIQAMAARFLNGTTEQAPHFQFNYDWRLPYEQRSFSHYLRDAFGETMVDQWAKDLLRNGVIKARRIVPSSKELREEFPQYSPLFVLACLDILGEPQRTVYILRKFKKTPREEIRNMLGLSSVRVVDSHYTHAQKNLNRVLQNPVDRKSSPEYANRLLENVMATLFTSAQRYQLYNRAQLTPYQRLVFYACAIQKIPFQELAQRMDRSSTGIQQALGEARDKLHPVLTEIDYRHRTAQGRKNTLPPDLPRGAGIPLGFLQRGWRNPSPQLIPPGLGALDAKAKQIRQQRPEKEYQIFLPAHFRNRKPDWLVCFDTLEPQHQAIYLLNEAGVPHALIAGFLGVSGPDGVNNVIHKIVIPALDQWRKVPPIGERLSKRYFYASLRHRLGKLELLALFQDAHLTDLERQVTYLTVFHNLTQTEISRLLVRSADSVSVALTKARQKIIPLAVQGNLIPEGYMQ